MANVIPTEIIENRILLIRNRKVMLDVHLAELYGVSTKALNQAVKRNRNRFPTDFMFELNEKEFEDLRSHFVTSSFRNHEHGGRRYLPFAFTEQGVAMLSGVLKSKRAIQTNIIIMRTFVKLREIMATHTELARKIEALEAGYAKHDKNIKVIFKIIKELLAIPPLPPEPEKSPIGFAPGNPKK